MPIIPIPSYHRDIYFGEPIDDLMVSQGDSFYLQLNIFDDEGVHWANGFDAAIFIFQSNRDLFSGSGDCLFEVSGSGSTVSGSSLIWFDEIATSLPGEYKAEIILESGAISMTAGTFNYMVQSD